MAARVDFTPTSRTEIQLCPGVPGFSVQRLFVAVARHRAAEVEDDVLVAVVVEIDEGDAVALLEVAGAGRFGDVEEPAARDRSSA